MTKTIHKSIRARPRRIPISVLQARRASTNLGGVGLSAILLALRCLFGQTCNLHFPRSLFSILNTEPGCGVPLPSLAHPHSRIGVPSRQCRQLKTFVMSTKATRIRGASWRHPANRHGQTYIYVLFSLMRCLVPLPKKKYRLITRVVFLLINRKEVRAVMSRYTKNSDIVVEK